MARQASLGGAGDVLVSFVGLGFGMAGMLGLRKVLYGRLSYGLVRQGRLGAVLSGVAGLGWSEFG